MLQSQLDYLQEQLNNSEPEPQQLAEEEVEVVEIKIGEEPDFHIENCQVSTSSPLTQFSQELGVTDNTMEEDNEDKKIR